MNRRLIIVALFLGGALVIAVIAITFMSRRPEAPGPVAKTESPRPAPAVERPRAAPPPPPPAPAAPRARRREPVAVSKPEPPPAPTETPAATVTLHIDSDVPGAQVFIDREYIGTTPTTTEHVGPGAHRLNASVQGYEGIVEMIDVSPGPRDILIKFKEVRLDARIDVVHKHRMGSCTGRLIATPQSFRYETANKGDAFSVGPLDVETFEVDYLQKNLTVKLRKGKTYNFTDPAGNADHLFVFHRDVEKALERLRKGDPPAKQ